MADNVIIYENLVVGESAMLSKVFSLRNLLIMTLIIFVLIVILRQQPILDSKKSAYNEAKTNSNTISALSDAQSLKADMSGTASEEEDYVRSEGYIFQGEFVFDYQD